MKVSCDIIKDLLPLHQDGVCSDDSKAMIEEHLLECETCKAELQAMEDALFLNKEHQNLKEASAIINLSKRWKKGMVQSLLEGALITIIMIAVIIFVLYLFVGIRVIT